MLTDFKEKDIVISSRPEDFAQRMVSVRLSPFLVWFLSIYFDLITRKNSVDWAETDWVRAGCSEHPPLKVRGSSRFSSWDLREKKTEHTMFSEASPNGESYILNLKRIGSVGLTLLLPSGNQTWLAGKCTIFQ